MNTAKIARDLQKAIKGLQSEMDELDAKIDVLKNTLSTLGMKPPRDSKRRQKARSKTGRKPNWSPAARKAAADRMRKYWAERRKGQKKTAKRPGK